MDWISIISLFSLRLISSYYWNHIPNKHSRICTLLFRSWFCLWTFSSKRTLDEVFVLHILLETDILGFGMPCAWISLGMQVSLEGSLFFNEPPAAVVLLDGVSRREAEAVVPLIVVVHCFLWLPDDICVPVKNRKKKKSIAWELYCCFQPSVPHHFDFQQNWKLLLAVYFKSCNWYKYYHDCHAAVLQQNVTDRNNQSILFIKISFHSK